MKQSSDRVSKGQRSLYPQVGHRVRERHAMMQIGIHSINDSMRIYIQKKNQKQVSRTRKRKPIQTEVPQILKHYPLRTLEAGDAEMQEYALSLQSAFANEVEETVTKQTSKNIFLKTPPKCH